MHRRVPIEDLIEAEKLPRAGSRPNPAHLRDALPRGWVLEPDGRHARRDLRLLFREGWMLVIGLIVFGSVGLGFLLGAMPDGWRGILRFGLLIIVVLAVGGLVGPWITRSLKR